jgi:hypothetical protein
VAVTVNGGVVLYAVGVPLSTPVPDSDSHANAGWLFVLNDHVTAPVAPPANNCWLYATLMVPFATPVGVTTGGPITMV